MTVFHHQGLWRQALLWMISLSSFFFISYGLANWITGLRSDVGVIVFAWEKQIPLWPWTIIPYWSIDLLYGLSFWLACSKRELNTLGRRLFTAQIICISGFLLFPLRFSFERPMLDGFFGMLFDLLMGFDKPFNQAPSLHITLLVILWDFYRKHLTAQWRWIMHVWFFLIGLSVLTTWQHHFFDLPTGILAGCLSIWLWPAHQRSPLAIKSPPKQWRWGGFYCLSAIGIALLATYFSGIVLLLYWLSIALLLVGLNYLLFGANGFQKNHHGRFAWAVWLLYAPYIAIAWVNSRLWTRKCHQVDHIIDNLYLGRIPDKTFLQQQPFSAILDLCAELPMPHYQGDYCLISILDMTVPSAHSLNKIVKQIDDYHQQHDNVLICCALGFSRSAVAIVAWLLWTQKAQSIAQAIDIVRITRPTVVINQTQRDNLQQWLNQLNEK